MATNINQAIRSLKEFSNLKLDEKNIKTMISIIAVLESLKKYGKEYVTLKFNLDKSSVMKVKNLRTTLKTLSEEEAKAAEKSQRFIKARTNELKQAQIAEEKVLKIEKEITNENTKSAKKEKDVTNEIKKQTVETTKLKKKKLETHDVMILQENQIKKAFSHYMTLEKIAGRMSFVITALASYKLWAAANFAVDKFLNTAQNIENTFAKVYQLLNDNDKVLYKTYLTTRALEVGADRAIDSLEDLSKSLYDIISVQFDPADAIKFLDQAAVGAIAGNTTITKATTVAIETTKAFGKEARDVSDVMDYLFTLIKQGKVTMSDLDKNFGRLANTASNLGMSMNELGSITSLITRTVNPQVAFTSLRQLMLNLSNPTQETIDLLIEYGLTAEDVNIRTNGLVNTIAKLNGITDEQKVKLASSKKGFDALANILNQLNDYYKVNESFMNRSGEALKAYNEKIDTTEFLQKKLRASFNSLFKDQTDFGEQVVKPLLRTMISFVENAEDSVEAIKSFATALVSLITVAYTVKKFNALNKWFVGIKNDANKANMSVGKFIKTSSQLRNLAASAAFTIVASGIAFVTAETMRAYQSQKDFINSLKQTSESSSIELTALSEKVKNIVSDGEKLEISQDSLKYTSEQLARYGIDVVSNSFDGATLKADDFKKALEEINKLIDEKQLADKVAMILGGSSERAGKALRAYGFDVNDTGLAKSKTTAKMLLTTGWDKLTGNKQGGTFEGESKALALYSMFEELKKFADILSTVNVGADTKSLINELESFQLLSIDDKFLKEIGKRQEKKIQEYKWSEEIKVKENRESTTVPKGKQTTSHIQNTKELYTVPVRTLTTSYVQDEKINKDTYKYIQEYYTKKFNDFALNTLGAIETVANKTEYKPGEEADLVRDIIQISETTQEAIREAILPKDNKEIEDGLKQQQSIGFKNLKERYKQMKFASEETNEYYDRMSQIDAQIAEFAAKEADYIKGISDDFIKDEDSQAKQLSADKIEEYRQSLLATRKKSFESYVNSQMADFKAQDKFSELTEYGKAVKIQEQFFVNFLEEFGKELEDYEQEIFDNMQTSIKKQTSEYKPEPVTGLESKETTSAGTYSSLQMLFDDTTKEDKSAKILANRNELYKELMAAQAEYDKIVAAGNEGELKSHQELKDKIVKLDKAIATEDEKLNTARIEEAKSNAEKLKTTITQAVSYMGQLYSAYYNMLSQNETYLLNKKLARYEKEQEAAEMSVSKLAMTERQKEMQLEAIRSEYDEKRQEAEDKAKKKQAKYNYYTSVANVMASTAQALIQAWAHPGTPYVYALLPLISAFGLAQIAAVTKSYNMAKKGFSEGGYTGDGDRYDVAGVVHKKEVVFEKPIVDGQVDDIMAIRRLLQSGIPASRLLAGKETNNIIKASSFPHKGFGYADGGYTGNNSISLNFAKDIQTAFDKTFRKIKAVSFTPINNSQIYIASVKGRNELGEI